jgi:hypothetical protein
MIGTETGYTLDPLNLSETSNDLTFLGWKAGSDTPTQINDAVAIGSGATVPASDAWVIGKIGSKQYIKEGVNGVMGIATLVAGTVTVNTTRVTTNSRIFLTPQDSGNMIGSIRVFSRVDGTSFTIKSTNATDTISVAWEIKEPF